MKRRYLSMSLAAIAVWAGAGAETNLPRVEILGREYYCYEVKKGESIYGIAKELGWDVEELVRLNPNTVANLEKGSRLYYPTGNVVVVKENESPVEIVDVSELTVEPVTHVVKKGETVYSISRLYNIPLETIYANHPSAKYGIKAGETIVIKQNRQALSEGRAFLYYNVKSGDTLFGLSKKFNTTVEEILKANPGVSEDNFKAGSTIRIDVNSASRRLRTEVVEEETVAAVDNYKVKKNETWSDISRNTGVDEATLREANSNTRPKKDEVVAVPKVEKVQVEREVTDSDPRESTAEGREQLYDSIHRLPDTERLREVNVALLMDDPSSKRDLEFSRGVLLAIDNLKKSPYKINFKIIDGRSATNAVIETLDDFEPQLLLTTADRNFPAFLADYGNENKVEIVNVFDVKNELYEDNPSMIQLLPPSSLFNDEVAEYVDSNFSGYTLITIGEKDENDAIGEAVVNAFGDSLVLELTANEIADFDFSDGRDYLVYSYAQKRDDILPVVNAVAEVRASSPSASVSLMGRPAWITLASTHGDKFAEADVFIPSRFYFDADSYDGKRFQDSFTDMFGHAPVTSFPMYSVTGYDVATYFIPAVASTSGDPNRPLPASRSMQTDINLKRVSNWGGFVNPTCYILKFIPGVGIDKITLK